MLSEALSLLEDYVICSQDLASGRELKPERVKGHQYISYLVNKSFSPCIVMQIRLYSSKKASPQHESREIYHHLATQYQVFKVQEIYYPKKDKREHHIYFSGLANHSRLQASHFGTDKSILAIKDSLTKSFKAHLEDCKGKDQSTFVTFYKVKRHNKPNERSLHKRLAAQLLYLSYSSISGGSTKDYVYGSRPTCTNAIMKLRQTLKIQDDVEAAAIMNLRLPEKLATVRHMPARKAKTGSVQVEMARAVAPHHENMSFNVPEYM